MTLPTSNLNDPDFKDHTFPLIGVLFSIRTDTVIMYFDAIQYSMNGPDKNVLLRVISSSEEEAIKQVLENGFEIKHQWHFHQELERLENDALISMGKSGITLITKENPYEGRDRQQGSDDFKTISQ
jgi:hypothetical protein